MGKGGQVRVGVKEIQNSYSGNLYIRSDNTFGLVGWSYALSLFLPEGHKVLIHKNGNTSNTLNISKRNYVQMESRS